MKYFYFLFALLSLSNVQSQIINIPDGTFKAKLLSATATVGAVYFIAKDINENNMKIDVNSNGEIEVSEAQAVYYLKLQDYNISNLSGIEFFTNLVYLDVAYNNLTNLNATALTDVYYLDLEGNNLSSLNINGLVNLRGLRYGGNNLPNYNLSQFTQLTELKCQNTGTTFLDVSALTELEFLVCRNNSIQTLDLTNCTKMKSVFCENNLITNLSIANFLEFYSLKCAYNPLVTLDLKFGLPLTSNAVNNIDITNCPSLQYICVDEYNTNSIKNKVASLGYSDCEVNSYCSFTPGENFQSISVGATFDSDANGCTAADINYPYIKYTISNGTTSESTHSDQNGNYVFFAQAGTHTVTPILENPTYFTVAPASITFDVSDFTNLVAQNFCLTRVEDHKDLAVTLLPITPARPGFNSSYVLVYKNKGNIIESGSVTLAFDDSVIDLVSSSPSYSTLAANNVTWNFSDLHPFESRSIEITYNINSPMEVPSVNIGDQLSFTAEIFPYSDDEIPFDNSSGLKQIVVGSLDPNDKTCIEGATISPALVGEYVHYVIRFENTGTYSAENIVVKDLIDTSKFDVTTLVPIASSHNFVTRINNNKVEFIFENINLPFDDANNDGFVAFKIKTKPTLVLGDTFSNTASIYFDYNFPIITNTETTTIAALGKQDFEFGNFLTLYPNPTTETIHLKKLAAISVSSISIYNMLGQQLIVIPNANSIEFVDVSSLGIGNYFLKIQSDKGASIAKFVKQ